MKDTPAAEAQLAPTASRGPARWFAGWPEERRRNAFLFAYATAFLITGAAIWLLAAAPGSSAEGARASVSRSVLLVLGINFLLITVLAAVIGRRAFGLFRRRSHAGARLHLRFVTLFSLGALS